MIRILFLFLSTWLIQYDGCDTDNTLLETNGDTTEITDDTAGITQLTEQEIADLLVLREEEKLARDVYLHAYDLYGMRISDNISRSEQVHMDRVLEILNANNIADPLKSDERGVFQNEDLQNLYNQLTEQNAQSYIEALKVGATIEDLDIKDIQVFKARAQDAAVLDMYEKLMCGSRNHIRSYNRLLGTNGIDYVPQYISQTDFDEIIAGAHERCGQM